MLTQNEFNKTPPAIQTSDLSLRLPQPYGKKRKSNLRPVLIKKEDCSARQLQKRLLFVVTTRFCGAIEI